MFGRILGINRPVVGFSSLGLNSSFGKRFSHELAPRFKQQQKKQKGRVTVRTGNSSKGTTLKFGQFGARLKSEGLRITAGQLKAADAVMFRPMKNAGAETYKRFCTNIAVCVKGNATRMGKGKGAFDHWMMRVPTGKVVYEVGGGSLDEHIAKDALRRACAKLPGVWEFVTRDSPARVGFKGFEVLSDEKVNYLEELKKNPTKKFKNLLDSKKPEYAMYTGRKGR